MFNITNLQPPMLEFASTKAISLTVLSGNQHFVFKKVVRLVFVSFLVFPPFLLFGSLSFFPFRDQAFATLAASVADIVGVGDG